MTPTKILHYFSRNFFSQNHNVCIRGASLTYSRVMTPTKILHYFNAPPNLKDADIEEVSNKLDCYRSVHLLYCQCFMQGWVGLSPGFHPFNVISVILWLGSIRYPVSEIVAWTLTPWFAQLVQLVSLFEQLEDLWGTPFRVWQIRNDLPVVYLSVHGRGVKQCVKSSES